jgi:probable rRNA maturation factor
VSSTGPPAGGPRVVVEDAQGSQPVHADHLAALAAAVLRSAGVTGDCELALAFVEEDAIAELNERFMGSAGPTDVLAFPIDGPPPAPADGEVAPADGPPVQPGVPVLLGDVVVCPAVAARYAGEHGRTLPDELALLVVHGVLHVLGMDHAERDEEAAMQARERELLARYHAS